MLRQLLDMPTRDYGAGARTETEKSMEDRPSSEDLLLQMGNTEANVSREKKILRSKEMPSASHGEFNRRTE